MVDRRRTEAETGQAAYQRLARRTEAAQAEANARVEQMFDTMLDEVRGLREEVRSVDQKSHLRSVDTERRLSDLEMQINMTRDEVQKRAIHPAPSQIEGAKTAIRETVKSPWGRVSILIAGVTSAIVLGQALPKAVAGIERFWDFLAGREVPAIARPLRGESPPVPEK